MTWERGGCKLSFYELQFFSLTTKQLLMLFLKVKLKTVKIKRVQKQKLYFFQLYKSQAPMKTGRRVSRGVGQLYFPLRIFCEK